MNAIDSEVVGMVFLCDRVQTSLEDVLGVLDVDGVVIGLVQ